MTFTVHNHTSIKKRFPLFHQTYPADLARPEAIIPRGSQPPGYPPHGASQLLERELVRVR